MSMTVGKDFLEKTQKVPIVNITYLLDFLKKKTSSLQMVSHAREGLRESVKRLYCNESSPLVLVGV